MDKELLKLAAKAAGIEEAKLRIEFNQWNPITDDGDALRLAVKLKLQIVIDDYMAIARTGNPHKYGAQESLSTDPLAATRRAIVRAAAEIGRRSMK